MLRSHLFRCSVFCLGLVCINVAARADSDLSADVTLTTDYVDAGLTQTSGHAAAQAGVTWSHDAGGYARIWTSTVDFAPGDRATAEVELVTGYAQSFAGFDIDLNAKYNIYALKGASAAAARERGSDTGTDAGIGVDPDQLTGADYNFFELNAALSRDTAIGAWSMSAAYTPNNAGHTGDALAVAVGWAHPITEHLSIDAKVQRSWRSAAADTNYFDWNVGFTYGFGWADLDLRYREAEDKACGGNCKARLVLSISKAF